MRNSEAPRHDPEVEGSRIYLNLQNYCKKARREPVKIKAFLHVLRAIHGVTGYNRFLIMGSQAILGHCLERGYEFSFNDSMEVDIAPVPDNQVIADLIDGTLGELSPFHSTFGYYVDGCDSKTAVFPLDWEQRLLETRLEGELVVYFPSPEDIAYAKYIAGREKDLEFVRKLWQEDLLDQDTMRTLGEKLPEARVTPALAILVKARVEGDMKRFCQEEDGTGPEP